MGCPLTFYKETCMIQPISQNRVQDSVHEPS